MFCTHFEEKVILLKFVHYELVFPLKVFFLIICGRNLTDECIGIFSDQCICIDCIGLDPALSESKHIC